MDPLRRFQASGRLEPLRVERAQVGRALLFLRGYRPVGMGQHATVIEAAAAQ